MIFETKRLIVRTAVIADADLFLRLWTNPVIMANVGFPKGLPTTREKIESDIASQGESEFQQLLVVELKSTGESIGECKMNSQDQNGIASTDVKLLPDFWGFKYGAEIKQGLLDYLFTHTDYVAVKATPNVNNVASVKMQELVGGELVGEETYTFPESMQSYTTPVHCYVYRVTRERWKFVKKRFALK